MLPEESLKDLLTQKSVSKADRLLLCLAVDPADAKAVKDIRELAVSSGLREAKKWNVSLILRSAPESVVRTDRGWELTAKGIQRVATIAGPLMNSPVPKVASALRSHLAKLTNADTQRFVEEAIGCFEARQYRAAVVLSWVGAVAVLYDYVVCQHITAFNAEAVSRNAASKNPWQPAKSADDLARMKESEFLVVLEKISVIGKSVKKELEQCLNRRNGCGHPNSLLIAEHVVASHIEILILNVFSKY